MFKNYFSSFVGKERILMLKINCEGIKQRMDTCEEVANKLFFKFYDTKLKSSMTKHVTTSEMAVWTSRCIDLVILLAILCFDQVFQYIQRHVSVIPELQEDIESSRVYASSQS